MKTLVILFASSKSLHIFDVVFAGKSSFDLSLEWAESVKKITDAETMIFADSAIQSECSAAVKASGKTVSCIFEEKWTVSGLFQRFSSAASEKNCENFLFAWADQPFINYGITEKILADHTEYSAEYTFADGYPEGLCPEALNAGTCSILAELSQTVQKEAGEKPVSRTSVFDLIKTDINSFEIETVLSDEDYRLLRLHFNCGTKGNMLACQELFQITGGKTSEFPIEELSEKARASENILKTVPAYYAVQVTDRINVPSIYKPELFEKTDGKTFVALSDFRKLVKKISLFSETAVVSLSAWGEAACHPDFVEMIRAVLAEPALSVLIETDGLMISEETARNIQSVVDSVPERLSGGDVQEKICWIVTLDAFSPLKYAEVHGGKDMYKAASDSVAMLEKYFPGLVYPQFTRMNENETELEGFFRFWSDKNSPSAGKLIVQKYDSFCGMLPDRKPADLSPLERNPCWHIRRDMTILLDGSVCFCRSCPEREAVGNAFKEPLEEIWSRLNGEVKCHMCNTYSKFCEKCDEYYTFNF